MCSYEEERLAQLPRIRISFAGIFRFSFFSFPFVLCFLDSGTVYHAKIKYDNYSNIDLLDPYTFLGNFPPTPSLSHFALS